MIAWVYACDIQEVCILLWNYKMVLKESMLIVIKLKEQLSVFPLSLWKWVKKIDTAVHVFSQELIRLPYCEVWRKANHPSWLCSKFEHSAWWIDPNAEWLGFIQQPSICSEHWIQFDCQSGTMCCMFFSCTLSYIFCLHPQFSCQSKIKDVPKTNA